MNFDFRKYLNLNFLVSFFLVPTVFIIICCGSYAYFYSLVFEEGVNYFFTIRLMGYSLILGGIVFGIILLDILLNKDQKFKFDHSPEKIKASHLVLLLIPLLPITHFIITNWNSLTMLNAMGVIVFFALISSIYIFGIPFILKRFSSVRILMGLGTSFIFTILSMASLSQYFSWLKFGSIKIQLPVLIISFVIIWMLLGLKNKYDLMIVVALFFIANTGYEIYLKSQVIEPLPQIEEESQLQSMIVGRHPARTPNIYLLIYDAYVTNETMLTYEIDNADQETYLRELGFIHYPETYSIGADTINTMSRVLNASTSFYGNPRRAVSGDGIVQNSLEYLGYQTYGLFPYDYMFRDVDSHYDYYFPKESQPTHLYLTTAILMGEFRFDLFELGFNVVSHEEYVIAKQEVFQTISDAPVFAYSHSSLPNHSQNSGKCLPNEIELYKERLQEANTEMRSDIEIILEVDPASIIIIAGDHGPYLTKNCTNTKNLYDTSEINRQDIQDRMGTFLAIKWPTEDFTAYDDIVVLQDIFPAIFSYLYQDSRFLDFMVDPVSITNLSGVTINNGIIQGGKNDGEPLFIMDKQK